MKRYTYILPTLLLFTLFGFGQAVKPIETEWTVDDKDNTYFKDINNILDKFVGTWKYEDTATNTVFEITFTKVLQAEGHKNGFVDDLSAKFKLIINNIVQYDTYNTDCEECFVPLGFSRYRPGELINNRYVVNQPNINMYIGAIAEPSFEDQVSASDLKLQFQLNIGSPPELDWTNRVSKAFTYGTNIRVNSYQMPLNMVLIKQ